MVDGIVDTNDKHVSGDIKITSCNGERNDWSSQFNDGCFNHPNKFKKQKFKNFKCATMKTTNKHRRFLIYKVNNQEYISKLEVGNLMNLQNMVTESML